MTVESAAKTSTTLRGGFTTGAEGARRLVTSGAYWRERRTVADGEKLDICWRLPLISRQCQIVRARLRPGTHLSSFGRTSARLRCIRKGMGSNGHWRCSCDSEGDMAREGSRRVAMRGIGSTWSDGSTLLHMATVRQYSRRTPTGETHGGRQEKAQGIARPGPALWKAVPRSRRWCWAASWWHEKGEEMEGINNNEGNKKGPTVGIEFLLTSHHVPLSPTATLLPIGHRPLLLSCHQPCTLATCAVSTMRLSRRLPI
ncbi:hypothetical protein [Oryza sativa Japonica Group]|uniref:Uncharacterized protein n=2 Tax=Oryza sativa subsp. japonica TaxID=39947 RepID=Q5JLV1_ORYSJ|nr:hypothetical protein [Oryza sativa Japonica Group]